jgi:hypothetical protein
MIRSAKDLSLDQKTVIEGLLGRLVLEEEEISVRAILPRRSPVSGGKDSLSS